jgi:cell division protein FtsW
LFYY